MEPTFIDWAQQQLGGNATISRETHGDQSAVYRLVVPEASYFLKIGSSLAGERDRLKWLAGKLPVPRVVGFMQHGDKDALLLTAIPGSDLAHLAKKWPADKIVDGLAGALRKFHAVGAKDCPFGDPGPDNVLVHGDACLPNFIFKEDALSGYVDLGDMRVDNPETDLAAAVWSLQYNLGPGHGSQFLRKYGAKDATEKSAERLRLQYEEMQKRWGLRDE